MLLSQGTFIQEEKHYSYRLKYPLEYMYMCGYTGSQKTQNSTYMYFPLHLNPQKEEDTLSIFPLLCLYTFTQKRGKIILMFLTHKSLLDTIEHKY